MSSNRVSSTQGSRDSRQTTATNASTGGRTTAPAEERSSTARSAEANLASHRSGVSSFRDSRSLDASGNSSNEGGLGRGGGSHPLPTATSQAGYGSGSQPAVAAAGTPTARPPSYQSSVPSVTSSPSDTSPPSYYAGTPAPVYSFVSSEHSSEYSGSTHAPMHSQAGHGQPPNTGAAHSAGTARDYGFSSTTPTPPTSHSATRGHHGRTDSANRQSLPHAPGMGHSLSQGPPATAHGSASAPSMARTHSQGQSIPGYAPGQHHHYRHEPYRYDHVLTPEEDQARRNADGGVGTFSGPRSTQLIAGWQVQSGSNAAPSRTAMFAVDQAQSGQNAPPTSQGSQAPGSTGINPSQGHWSNQASPSNQSYPSQSHHDPRARYSDQPPRRAPGGGRQ